jgi:hypothetical protein
VPLIDADACPWTMLIPPSSPNPNSRYNRTGKRARVRNYNTMQMFKKTNRTAKLAWIIKVFLICKYRPNLHGLHRSNPLFE